VFIINFTLLILLIRRKDMIKTTNITPALIRKEGKALTK
jgi:hypothetical protein